MENCCFALASSCFVCVFLLLVAVALVGLVSLGDEALAVQPSSLSYFTSIQMAPLVLARPRKTEFRRIERKNKRCSKAGRDLIGGDRHFRIWLGCESMSTADESCVLLHLGNLQCNNKELTPSRAL